MLASAAHFPAVQQMFPGHTNGPPGSTPAAYPAASAQAAGAIQAASAALIESSPSAAASAALIESAPPAAAALVEEPAVTPKKKQAAAAEGQGALVPAGNPLMAPLPAPRPRAPAAVAAESTNATKANVAYSEGIPFLVQGTKRQRLSRAASGGSDKWSVVTVHGVEILFDLDQIKSFGQVLEIFAKSQSHPAVHHEPDTEAGNLDEEEGSDGEPVEAAPAGDAGGAAPAGEPAAAPAGGAAPAGEPAATPAQPAAPPPSPASEGAEEKELDAFDQPQATTP